VIVRKPFPHINGKQKRLVPLRPQKLLRHLAIQPPRHPPGPDLRNATPKSNRLTIELAIPRLRSGSYFPSFLEHRRRAERALASVVATSYLLGVSTRRVEKLAASLGVVGLSKSQVSAMAAELDELVEGFRNRPLDAGPYTFVWIDALTQKVREGGRTVNVHCLIATGVNADGCREILGIEVTSSEDGAGWLAFLRGLAARGLSGVALVTSDDHAGLVSAIAAVLPGAALQRCRTHCSCKDSTCCVVGRGVWRGCRSGEQVAAGAVAGCGWRGDMPGLVEEREGFADGVADRGPADTQKAGQHVHGAQVPLVEDGQQDALTVADLLVEDAAAGSGLAEAAAPLIGEDLSGGEHVPDHVEEAVGDRDGGLFGPRRQAIWRYWAPK
jgi:putative transposase